MRLSWWHAAVSGIAVLSELPAAREPTHPRVVATTPTTSAAREQEIETEVPAKPPAKPPRAKAKPKKVRDERPNGNPRVKTPDDEDLPSWCPVSGRLTVVESSDIAKNLGLLDPQPTPAAPASTVWPYIPGETFVDAR